MRVTKDEIAAAIAAAPNRYAQAQLLGVSERTLRRWLADKADYRSGSDRKHEFFAVELPEIERPELVSGDLPIEELIARRIDEFDRKRAFTDSRKLIRIKVNTMLPIGVTFLGDPHTDDSGCDLKQLLRDATTIRSTGGLYGACVGDVTNNWIGRLAALYAHQETTAAQGWQLTEYWIRELRDWLFLVNGNHDHWHSEAGGNPLNWIMRQTKAITGNHTVRLALCFPNGKEVRITSRHSFSGNSQWNPTHGALKASLLQYPDHILVAGHTHQGGYQMVRNSAHGHMSHLIACDTYKTLDDYGDAGGFPDRHISPATTALIDPASTTEVGLIKIEHDTQSAADRLTWMRDRSEA